MQRKCGIEESAVTSEGNIKAATHAIAVAIIIQLGLELSTDVTTNHKS